MNAIEQLRDVVLAVLPDVHVELDPAEDPNGRWFLDLVRDDHRVVVEWLAARGFGVTASERSAFGEGSEETFPDLAAVTERVLHLLRTKEPIPQPPHGQRG